MIGVRVFMVMACVAACGTGTGRAQGAPAGEWTAYGGDAGGLRHSRAAQITPANVRDLRVAWVYRTGDYTIDEGGTRFEATPLLVDGTLYVSTPFGRVIALDPRTGHERWSYDPRIDLSGDYGDFANRGVSTWLDTTRAPGAACRRRIYVAPIDARLISLDAATGRPCRDFGRGGQVDLKRDLVNEPAFQGEYMVTSPPAVSGNLVIVGSAIADNNRADTPSGVVRAFDVRTGALRWSWDPHPRRTGLPGYESWRGPGAARAGAANAWSIITADPERDLVFVPVGSASPDFYGGERLGSNLFANSIVALRASTGQMVWHFQAVHHDLWDYDVPAQPVLFTLRRGADTIPAVVQATKMGHLFFFNRETGAPLFPVEERAVPRSDVAGEEAWPTQPFPVAPKPLVPASLTAADAWGATPADRDWCRQRLGTLRSEGIFTPPSLGGTVLFPGNIGGSNWSGVTIDPARGILVAPTNRLATVVHLIPRASFDSVRRANPRAQSTPQRGTPYGMMRYTLRAPNGAPCNPPPWGALTAIDLATGAVRWERPLGHVAALSTIPESAGWGSPNLGGAMTTASGLVFVAATLDEHLRAFDIGTGAELWKWKLPAGGNAMPMTYEMSGRQYLVIAAGGRGGMGTTLGDHVVAFALPGGTAPIDTASHPADGTWSGEILFERTRHPTVLRLADRPGSRVEGELRMNDGAIRGPLTGTRTGNTITYTVSFTFPERRCTGTVTGTAELANGGSLLVGELRISGPCSGESDERGTMAVRK